MIGDAKTFGAADESDLWSAYLQNYTKFQRRLFAIFGVREPPLDFEHIHSVQVEGLLLARRKLEQFDSSKGSMAAWLWTVTKNYGKDYWVRSGVESPSLMTEEVEGRSEFEMSSEIDEAYERKLQKIKEILSGLSDNERYLIVSESKECTWKEIGDTIGISPKAALGRFRRLISRLQREHHVTIVPKGNLNEK